MKYVIVSNPIIFICYDYVLFEKSTNDDYDAGIDVVKVKRKDNQIIWKLTKKGIAVLKSHAIAVGLMF
jgi:hypothetical protein